MSEPTEPAVLRHTARGVTTLTLNQPAKRNALSVELVVGLLEGLDAALDDPAVRAVVVTHHGPVFCAGADLSAVTALAERGLTLTTLLERILDAPKPTIARINGACRGGGVGLAAAFDISLAAASATFAFSEARLGVAPAVISVVCLPKMSRAAAAELFLRSRTFDAAEAAASGLITRAVPDEALDAAVNEVLADVVAGGPQALAACKELLQRVPQLGRDEAFAWTAELSARLFTSAEGREGVAAFREKRPPNWVPQKEADDA